MIQCAVLNYTVNSEQGFSMHLFELKSVTLYVLFIAAQMLLLKFVYTFLIPNGSGCNMYTY